MEPNLGAKHTYGVPTPAPDFENTRCILLWGTNPEATDPCTALRIRRAQTRGTHLIVIDPRRHSLARRADRWLRLRPGSDGVLALAMIHVLLDERLYDDAFARDWTTAPFLVRQDTRQLLTGQDLGYNRVAPSVVAWDIRSQSPVVYAPAEGFKRDDIEPALSGRFAIPLSGGDAVACQPALGVLGDIAAEYSPERTEHLTWVPAAEVRRAVRLFASEKPSCYMSWTGTEQHKDAGQINRAVCCFYALTGQFDRRGSNVLFASTPTQPVNGAALLAPEQLAKRLGLQEHPPGVQFDPGSVRAADVCRAILTGAPYPIKSTGLIRKRPATRPRRPVARVCGT